MDHIEPQQSQAGTTLEARVQDTTAHFIRRFPWSINKTVSPEVLNLFRGDTGTATYTISVVKGAAVNEAYLEGLVCVTNGGERPTENLTIQVAVDMPPSQTPFVSGPVDVSSKPVLGPGESACYRYRINILSNNIIPGRTYRVTANVTITNHSGHLGDPFGPSPRQGVVMPLNPTVVNNTIQVHDTSGRNFTFTNTDTASYNRTFTCNDDQGTHTNTATIVGTNQSDSATVQVNCYDLLISKTAQTSFTRTYHWTIDKQADVTEGSTITLPVGQTFTVQYRIVLTPTFTDSNHRVRGIITIKNPAPIAATITSVTDIIPSTSIVGNVQCNVEFPYVLAPGGTLNCPYEVILPDSMSRINRALVTIKNHPMGTTTFPPAQVPFDFGNATITEIDRCVTVTDSFRPSFSQTICVDSPSKTISFTHTVGPYTFCSPTLREISNTAMFITQNRRITGSDTFRFFVRVPCTGCTRTIGYWMNHPQELSELLPIWIGTPGGNFSVYVNEVGDAIFILNRRNNSSNAINRLSAQLLAAKLNIANGASVNDPAVSNAITGSDAFLATHGPGSSLTPQELQQVNQWQDILDQYNNGLRGTPHCD